MTLREQIEEALQDSTGSCARCKCCATQVDAVMAVLHAAGGERTESTDFILQAALTETPENWQFLEGISYPSRELLDEAYERHFRHIDGQGCVYRRVKVVQVTTVTVLGDDGDSQDGGGT